MEAHERELFIARICSGVIRLQLSGETYVLRRPSSEHLYIAQEVYNEAHQEALSEGLYSESELYDMLMSTRVWNEENAKLLEKLPKEIEELKFQAFNCLFKSNERKTIRKALKVAKAKYQELFSLRHAYDHLSCLGYATLLKTRYIIAMSLFKNGEPITERGLDGIDGALLDEAIKQYAVTRLSEEQYRELCRMEPWRSMWTCKKSEDSVFGVPAAFYTEDQRNLVCWSVLYDNVYSSPACPSDVVVEDDDLLDGWMIKQRRERDSSVDKTSAEELISNEKIRNAGEVYLVADTADDARRIDELNDESAKHIKRQRFRKLAEEGEVNEMNMPDTRKRLVMEVTNRLSQVLNNTGK